MSAGDGSAAVMRGTGAASVGDLIAEIAPRLAAAGIADSRREAQLLLALALKVEPRALLGAATQPVDERARRRLAALVERRMAREPYARLAGTRGFWSLDFLLSPETLEPRPDSETLIEAALAAIPDRHAPLSVIDFGTGSGCLLLALLTELPNATGVGIDIVAGAVATARLNAARAGLAARSRFIVGHWGEALSTTVDVILANPPYIPSEDIDGLAPEVARHDPRKALDGGRDGLDAYRVLAQETRRLLRPSGVALFEVGAGQAAAVTAIMAGAGLATRGVRRDLGGIERCLTLAQPQPS